MFGIETLGGTAQAVAIVGLVFVEAILLYFGYGAVEHVMGVRVTSVLRGRCAVADAFLGDCPERDSAT